VNEWSALYLSHFTPKEGALGTHWIGSLVGPRASLDVMVKNLYEILTWYCFWLPHHLAFEIKCIHNKHLCCSFAYWQSLCNFCNHQIMVSITVSSSERSHINYTWMPSFTYQDMIWGEYLDLRKSQNLELHNL